MSVLYSLHTIDPGKFQRVLALFPAGAPITLDHLKAVAGSFGLKYGDDEIDEMGEERSLSGTLAPYANRLIEAVCGVRKWSMGRASPRDLLPVFERVPALEPFVKIGRFDQMDVQVPQHVRDTHTGVFGGWTGESLSDCATVAAQFRSKSDLAAFRARLPESSRLADVAAALADWERLWETWELLADAVLDVNTARAYMGVSVS